MKYLKHSVISKELKEWEKSKLDEINIKQIEKNQNTTISMAMLNVNERNIIIKGQIVGLDEIEITNCMFSMRDTLEVERHN